MILVQIKANDAKVLTSLKGRRLGHESGLLLAQTRKLHVCVVDFPSYAIAVS